MSKHETPLYIDGVQSVIDTLRKFEVDIRRALRYGGDSHSFDKVCHDVLTGKVLFYPLPNSVMLFEIQEYPNHKVFHGYIAAGDLEELMTVGQKIMLREAKKFGCKYVSMAGRRGWERALKDHGWTAPLVILYKEVSNEQDV